MNRILLSIMTIALVATVAVGATRAYFTDTEQSLGNTFSTGTIDIAVDGANPWSRTNPFAMVDMKPSQVDYTNFTINNVGTNPANVWKKVANVVTSDDVQSEPECLEGNGTWSGTACTGSYSAVNNIDSVINYDLSVKVYNAAGTEIFNQTLYNKDKTVSQIRDTDMFLGMIPEGGKMDVTESYHMQSATTNWAQGDKMIFNIVLTAEQLKGIAILENKSNDGLWQVLGGDSYTGTFTYGVKDSKLIYTFTGVAPLASTPYSLIVYHEPWSTPSSPAVWPRPVTILGSATSDGIGNISIPSTSVELNTNLLDAKVWLVKSSDLVGNTISGWDPSSYLFDTGLIDYYDSDL